MTVKTERTGIRLITGDDRKQLREIWEDLNRSEYARYDRPHPADDAGARERTARWAAANASGTDHMFFAICLGDTVIGYCAFNKRDAGYEIGYGFRTEYRGKGYAKESISALLCHMRETGAQRFTAGTALGNVPSVSLLNSLGFRQTAAEKVSFYKDTEGNDVIFDGGVFELTFAP